MRILAELALELILANVVFCGDGKITRPQEEKAADLAPICQCVYSCNNVRAGNTVFTSVYRYLMLKRMNVYRN
jgi:hypothetical protein